MFRRWSVVGLTLLPVVVSLTGSRGAPPPTAAVQWIWFDEGDPAQDAPAETRYFRRGFALDGDAAKGLDEAALDITADNSFTVWLNGAEVGRGDTWQRVYTFDVRKRLVPGKNLLAVAAHNEGGPAGLLVRLSYVPHGRERQSVVSDATWKAAKAAAPGWEKADRDEAGWSPVKVIGPFGQAGPWRDVAWGGTVARGGRFIVPEGFRVEPAAKNPQPGDPFSLVNMTFDGRGRLLVSRENGPILLCTGPDGDGVLQDVRPYCEQVKNCQGMCWVKGALYLVGDGPQGTGLYRVRDTKGADRTDEVTLLHRYGGGMGEHGPHAVIHGPDGCLYLVIGNHAWAQPKALAVNSPLRRWPTGGMGPDQGSPNTTEDVLLPRMNDAHGHAANILAPGGTIWRMDLDGGNAALVAAGFRNHFDAAFSTDNELFTFDSDMEWDENLPWYRAVRVCHCPPGADFSWRTGSANTPGYYLDSLPPLYETGRGSPVGLEFYDHHVFPEKYHGAYFMADWSIGVIWAVHLRRDGATYHGDVEKFCVGAPMNVTDLAVAPDGSIYFTMGGRGTQGGVYRIVFGERPAQSAERHGTSPTVEDALRLPQPLSAWGQAQRWAIYHRLFELKQDEQAGLREIARDSGKPVWMRRRALNELINPEYFCPMHPSMGGATPGKCPVCGMPLVSPRVKGRASMLLDLARESNVDIRAHAVWLLGVNGYKDGGDALVVALRDEDALVRRRACEALIRAGIEPQVEAVWPLLADKDHFVRTAARLVLQRIDPEKWAGRVVTEPDDLPAWEAIVALCKTNQAAPYAERIFRRLQERGPAGAPQAQLDYLRTVQLALIHTGSRPASVQGIAERCDRLFPQRDDRVNRELAILLSEFARAGLLPASTTGRLVDALEQGKEDRQQQIHYFYCLRLLKDGWTPELRDRLLHWYDATRTWQGGSSFTPFLENIFRETLGVYPVAERRRILENAETLPLAALVVAQREQSDGDEELLRPLGDLADRLAKADRIYRRDELRSAVADAVSKIVLRHPTGAAFPYLVHGLDSTNPVVLLEVIEALKKAAGRPKPEDAVAYRAAVLAGRRLDVKNRWKAVELLRRWSNGKQFGADEGAADKELDSWGRWYAQSFPAAPPLPNVGGVKAFQSKHRYDELLTFLDRDPAGRRGDASRGRKVFDKAQCLKCHKFGKEGEGIGPDLTTLAKRFKRADILESIYYPSKVISDQYRSTVIVTTRGQQFTGLAAPMGGTVTLLQSDGTKVVLNAADVDQQYASLVSVMPEKLLDALTKEEIADLFAFLESEPK
jgi:putative heme-binding domain-containing protein